MSASFKVLVKAKQVNNCEPYPCTRGLTSPSASVVRPENHPAKSWADPEQQNGNSAKNSFDHEQVHIPQGLVTMPSGTMPLSQTGQSGSGVQGPGR